MLFPPNSRALICNPGGIANFFAISVFICGGIFFCFGMIPHKKTEVDNEEFIGMSQTNT